MDRELQKTLDEQTRLSKLLSQGFIFSLIWLGGLGSLIALISGIRGLMLIKRAKGQLTGKRLAWWCVIVGGIGVIFLPLFMYYSRLTK